jgi:ribosomal protein S18 acetylase RimI-like enzyme
VLRATPTIESTMTASDHPAHLGRRVVVRYRRPPGSHPPLTDVVGVLTSVDDHAVTVEASAGPVTVRRADVVVMKTVPPPPVRRGRPHTAVSTLDLERLMADGWRAVEEEWLGDWMLRASSGFTGRGNSVLPLGDPASPMEASVGHVEEWYAARGLPPRFHLDLPPSGDAADEPLGMVLLDRGYRVVTPTVVMTGASADIDPLRDGASPVHVSASLSAEWLAAYARQRPTIPGVTEQLLTGSPGQLFLSTSDRTGALTAVARMSVHPGWAGMQALWVEPELRGRGLGRTVVHAAGMLARQRRMTSVYLQVEAENEAAIGLYESEGFRPHHTYAYLVVTAPAGD